MIFMLKPMNCDHYRDAPQFGFRIWSISGQKVMGPNEFKNLTLVVGFVAFWRT